MLEGHDSRQLALRCYATLLTSGSRMALRSQTVVNTYDFTAPFYPNRTIKIFAIHCTIGLWRAMILNFAVMLFSQHWHLTSLLRSYPSRLSYWRPFLASKFQLNPTVISDPYQPAGLGAVDPITSLLSVPRCRISLALRLYCSHFAHKACSDSLCFSIVIGFSSWECSIL
jgi:hypothetical protein